MDVITHAFVGACSGMVYNRPLLGAVIAAAPDMVLGIKRKAHPTSLYNFTHSLTFILLVMVLTFASFGQSISQLAGLCLLSHITLDIPTHGKEWAPPLLYPFNKDRTSYGEEWEFFNSSWWQGFRITVIWSILCLLAL